MNNVMLRSRVIEQKYFKTVQEQILFLKHKKSYEFVSQCCSDKNVLDFGCGTGYGANLLSSYAKKVIGADIDNKVLTFCQSRYHTQNLLYTQITPDFFIKFRGSFDIITSFQVIEHVDNVEEYLLNLQGLLAKKGTLFVTTCNRAYRLYPFQKPWNPEHKREYDLKGFKRVLEKTFSDVEIKCVYGTDEINIIETRRCKKMIMGFPLESMLKKLALFKTREEQVFKENYDLNQFFVGKELNKALDFMGICSIR